LEIPGTEETHPTSRSTAASCSGGVVIVRIRVPPYRAFSCQRSTRNHVRSYCRLSRNRIIPSLLLFTYLLGSPKTMELAVDEDADPVAQLLSLLHGVSW
jgi:hypothetical protein